MTATSCIECWNRCSKTLGSDASAFTIYAIRVRHSLSPKARTSNTSSDRCGTLLRVSPMTDTVTYYLKHLLRLPGGWTKPFLVFRVWRRYRTSLKRLNSERQPPRDWNFNPHDYWQHRLRHWRMPGRLVSGGLFSTLWRGGYRLGASLLPVLCSHNWIPKSDPEEEPALWTPIASLSRRRTATLAGINKQSPKRTME